MSGKNFDQFEASYRQRNDRGNDFRRPGGSAKVARILGTILIALIVILALAVAGFFLSQNSNKNKWGSEEISFKLDGPEQISAGQEAIYNLNLTNLASAGLTQTEIAINWPEGFTLTTAEPNFDQTLERGGSWKVGNLDGYQKKTFVIKGRLFGKSDEKKMLGAALTYQPQNFSSKFTETASFETKISDSLVEATWDFPEQVVSGDENSGQIKIKPSADLIKAFSSLSVVMEYSNGFELVAVSPSSTPSTRESSLVWKIDKISSTEQIINFKGKVTGSNNEKKLLKLKIFGVDGIGQESPALIDWEKNVYLTKNPLVLTTTVNGKSEGEAGTGWGEELTVTLKYKNTSDQKLENSVLEASFDPTTWIDWESLKLGGTLSKVDTSEIERGGVLVFNGTQIPTLKSLEVGQEGTISFTLKLKDTAPSGADTDKGLTLRLKMTAGDFKLEAPEIKIKLSSKIGLTADARFFSDDYNQIGSGPLPPKVGEITNYKIRLGVTNSGNALKNAKVVVKLGQLADWNGQETQTEGDLIYETENRMVTWEIGKVSGDEDSLKAGFEVALKPTADYVGDVLVLVSSATLTATDTVTGQELTTQIPAKINTNLKGDPMAAGKGVVVE